MNDIRAICSQRSGFKGATAVPLIAPKTQMWPRRQQRTEGNGDGNGGSSTATGTAASGSKKPAVKDSDNCGWLMRAMDKKKSGKRKVKKAASSGTTGWSMPSKAKPTAATTASSTQPTTSTTKDKLVVDPCQREIPSLAASTEATKPKAALAKASSSTERSVRATAGPTETTKRHPSTQKRSLRDSSSASHQPAKKKAAFPVPSAWKPQVKDRKPPTQQHESFDDVFEEVFGIKQTRDEVQDAIELPSAALSNESASADSRSRSTTTKATQKKVETAGDDDDDEEWTFATEGPDVSLADFDDAGDDDGRGVARSKFSQWKQENQSHAVSDNFVKLNMRKRFKGRSGNAKKRPAYLRGHLEPPPDPTDPRGNGPMRATRDATESQGGYLNDGVDFIEECLELLDRLDQSGVKGSINPTTTTTTATTTPPAIKEVEPPRCHHALLTRRLVVKKKNKNCGRGFFSCPMGNDEGRCDFFMWEDDQAELALQTLVSQRVEVEDDGVTAQCVPIDLAQPIDEQQDALVTNLRLVFGHANFRQGQEWAIKRIFQAQTTLLVLPTGAGKSLCYQYPAMFLPGITIVISPLISLMNDQFQNLPAPLQARAACVTSAVTNSKVKYAEFVRDLLGGKIKLLFLSPEKALTNGFQQLLMQIRTRLSLICVDEAHCISEWSHHFRPSFLRLKPVLALAKCVLAITATASQRVIDDILAQFKHGFDERAASNTNDSSLVPTSSSSSNDDMVMRMPWQRSNLFFHVLQVESNEERLEHLCRFLTSTKITGGIILYVHQQRHAEDMAGCLTQQLPPAWHKKIAYYHAGMEADAKEKVRTGFLKGRLRVVIATIAFGMGIDKQNVRCVIHYHVPSSVENYLQQVGRAGRDGKPAFGLLYLLPQDVVTFRSLLFSNAFDRSQLDTFMQLVLQCGDPAEATSADVVAVIPRASKRTLLSMAIDGLEAQLDMKSAVLETFLTLASLRLANTDSGVKLRFLPTGMSVCTLQLHEKHVANSPFLAQVIQAVVSGACKNCSLDREEDGYLRVLNVTFHVCEMAQHLYGHEVIPDDARERRLLQAIRASGNDGHIQRSKMSKLAFRLELTWTQDKLTPEARQQLATDLAFQLYAKHTALEAMGLKRLTRLYAALHTAAIPSGDVDVTELTEPKHCERHINLERKLVQYFDDDDLLDNEDAALMKELTERLTPESIDTIERDARYLIHALQDENDTKWTAYTVAKIFHGLTTKCYPTSTWRDHPCWRKYDAVAFEQLVAIATKVVGDATIEATAEKGK
ncbi:TPA: hypothetical protein N0F65_010897 [Lagenidium giganteum]|uniref:DNA 3'-5' helicase n=1 Tax=Lagenidium giganteum TaxID=4803 RepID=A0AAV2YHC2_9STRA|nr:TPA: hypothetical protein N0F65_010897 [Lagenidium giganteum]